MRVLSITPELPSADKPGSMAPTLRQIESLRALGFHMDVVELRGIPKLKYAQALRRLRPHLKLCDLVHAHFGYCGWLGRLQWRRPLVISFMGDDLLGTPDEMGRPTRFSRAMVLANRRLARLADAVIVKSAEMARVVAPVAAHVIPNGVDLARFQPHPRDAARDELGWSQGPRRVLFPGNAENPRKGFSLAVAAVRCAERLLGEPIELVGLWGIPPERVPLYMNASDAMILASLSEGSPNVVKEAMACDLRVVSVPVGDVAELMADTPGYHIGPRDSEALGRLLAETLASPGEVAGRRTMIERGLDLPAVAERVAAVYRQVLQAAAEQRRGPAERPAAECSEMGTR